MAVQYDFQPGFDLSSLTLVTQAQLMQAISQIAPLDNIGGILIGDPTIYDAAFISDNPRCARYVLIDNTTTPYTLKTWSGAAWVAATVGTGSIDNVNMFADDLITIAKLDQGEAAAMQVLHMNSGGTALEYVNPTDLFTPGDNEILLSYLDKSGALSNQFLRYKSSQVIWDTYDPTPEITNLSVSQITGGTANFLLRTGTSGPEWVSNDDSVGNFLAAGGASSGIALSKIRYDSTKPYGVPRVNAAGNALEWKIDMQLYESGSVAMPADVTTVAHSLNGIPDIVQVNLVALNTTYGYAVGDRVSPLAITVSNPGNYRQPVYWFADATNVNVVLQAAGVFTSCDIQKADGTATTGVSRATFVAAFNIEIKAIWYNR